MKTAVAVVLAFALGVLPAVHDVCGPACAMGDRPIIVAVADGPADGECPLHPSEPPTPSHENAGCTHEHGVVREAPESTSALAPSVSQPLQLPAALFSPATLPVMSPRAVRAAAAPPIARFPRSLALRI